MAKNTKYYSKLMRNPTTKTRNRNQTISYKRTNDERKYPTFKNTREESIKKLIIQLILNANELKKAINTANESQQFRKLKKTFELLENVILYTKPENL